MAGSFSELTIHVCEYVIDNARFDMIRSLLRAETQTRSDRSMAGLISLTQHPLTHQMQWGTFSDR